MSDLKQQPQYQPPQRHPEQSEEDWQEQLAEEKAHAQRLWRQSGGQLDVWPCPASQPVSKQ